jgi:hypothetical protein
VDSVGHPLRQPLASLFVLRVAVRPSPMISRVVEHRTANSEKLGKIPEWSGPAYLGSELRFPSLSSQDLPTCGGVHTDGAAKSGLQSNCSAVRTFDRGTNGSFNFR